MSPPAETMTTTSEHVEPFTSIEGSERAGRKGMNPRQRYSPLESVPHHEMRGLIEVEPVLRSGHRKKAAGARIALGSAASSPKAPSHGSEKSRRKGGGGWEAERKERSRATPNGCPGLLGGVFPVSADQGDGQDEGTRRRSRAVIEEGIDSAVSENSNGRSQDVTGDVA